MIMREIGAFEAKNTLGSLLDLVEKGEEVVITRRGKPVARLVRETGGVDREKARRAAADMLANSKGVRLEGLKLKDLIEEGRR
jgi:antitoxin (DNA-binding transcriptional repressor) of toxin-antitoxin stability system